MRTQVIDCKILAGKHGTNAQQRMHEIGNKHGSVNTVPWKFWCGSCRTEYEGTEISVGTYLETVSCSNCSSGMDGCSCASEAAI